SGLLITLVIMALILVADALRDTTASNRSRTGSRRAGAQGAAADDDTVVDAEAPLLRVRDMSVAFHGLEVVSRVGFDVRPGQALGIVGESGCGKSVTASAVLGSLGPEATTTGHVVFEGQELVGAPRSVRAGIRGSGIAYISQDPMVALDPSFTVASQLG